MSNVYIKGFFRASPQAEAKLAELGITNKAHYTDRLDGLWESVYVPEGVFRHRPGNPRLPGWLELAGPVNLSKDDVLKLAVEAGVHSAIVFINHGSNIDAMTRRERQDFADIQQFARLIISALNKKVQHDTHKQD